MHCPLDDKIIGDSVQVADEPQPDLAELTFAVLLPLTEAAPKYRVYAAISSCKNALRPLIPAHSLPILSAALGWKDRLLVDEEAKHAIALPAEEVVWSLDASYLAPWIIYHRSWMTTLSTDMRYRDPISRHWEGTKDQVGAKPMANPCEVWTELWAMSHSTWRVTRRSSSMGEVSGEGPGRTLGLRCTACEV
ncbi:hypothetical protein ARMGADRAFT_1073853 [Armillaria gallica]|uniref:Uncharacterized protein n=1 Tax=Armillaria gallica TaxID=47427 RepID=A0A2H3DUM0_ARMGA|nr:hypothetical protein ARMGADRAFT_1073853 [Armillaria gallica]